MADAANDRITALLHHAADGDPPAVSELLNLVYDELRLIARKHIAAERPGHTLTATALVHEAYLKLVGEREVPWNGRSHFFHAAAEAMRRILIDHARAKAAEKRGGGELGAAEARRVALDLAGLPDLSSPEESAGFLILDDAISRLDEVDAQAASVVHLRYFTGLSIDQTAEALNVSAPTVKRAWTFARAWLKDAIESNRV